jgi:hypothetical protein
VVEHDRARRAGALCGDHLGAQRAGAALYQGDAAAGKAGEVAGLAAGAGAARERVQGRGHGAGAGVGERLHRRDPALRRCHGRQLGVPPLVEEGKPEPLGAHAPPGGAQPPGHVRHRPAVAAGAGRAVAAAGPSDALECAQVGEQPARGHRAGQRARSERRGGASAGALGVRPGERHEQRHREGRKQRGEDQHPLGHSGSS